MKELFDKIGLSIKDTYKEAVEQTHKTVDQTKYRTEIMGLKNELKKLYQQLGEFTYKDFIEETELRDYTPLCSRITHIRKQVQRLEAQIGEVVNNQKQGFDNYKENVKNTWQEDQKYYTNINQEVKSYKFCENCNIGNSSDAVYCVNCGNKF